MKIAILTAFNGLSPTYSLSNVVEQHVRMFLNHNIETKLIVNEQCDLSTRYGAYLDERIEWFKLDNTLNGNKIKWIDYSNPTMTLHDTFYEEVDVIYKSLKKALEDVSVCFLHDILFQGWHYVHNVAVRKVQKDYHNIKFIALTHSFPVNRPAEINEQMKYRYISMPNTIFAYPTYSGLPALAKQYDVPEGLCRVIYNNISLTDNMHQSVIDLNNKINILDSDILIIFPARLSPGKQPEKIAAMAGMIHTVSELSVKLIFCDFPCMDIDSKEYKSAIKVIGEGFGLDVQNIIFTSDYGYEKGFPRQGVMDLFTLSNLFICPSKSESFGLTVIEAASRGNFIVLNRNVPALEEIGKSLNAYFMEWDARESGYDIKVLHKPSEIKYYEENAKKIINLMRDDKVLFAKTKVRKRYSEKFIWKNQIEPLINTNL